MDKKALGSLFLAAGAAIGLALANRDKIAEAFGYVRNPPREKKKQAKSPFYCNLSGEIMEDPVLTPYDTCYDRKNIENWIEVNHTCPITKKRLELSDLRPNITLKLAIDQYKETLRK